MTENYNSLSYNDCYINHSDTPETSTRRRRCGEFRSTSALVEVQDYTSPKHQTLRKCIQNKSNGNLDHTSFWRLGKMAVIMTEPYHGNLEDYECDELYVVQIPNNIAPYCGSWTDRLGAEPGTKSFLITSPLKKRQLEKVLEKLKKAAEILPPWNYLEEASK